VNLLILPSAHGDLRDGFNFYEKQQTGLGGYFLDSVSADIDSLALYAGIHRRVHGAHRLLCGTFPFAVYYEIDEPGAAVKIKAVLDCRKDPMEIAAKVLGK
jgi:hypothetical protein